ncbi:hypothetical protein NBRC10512_002983 [Rhodotorula toruloides]|uniref:RHTO0S17e02652g1_1 n=2 Tax=Rhodotorula toruloides TaxID=5286 RepID=A0A061BEI2_RHOTO|nr:major facilitator superfamily protein [Rhodotorula toruloides NP11]EMS20498.1 major facilitator superfamily protein [Rhodotorula toruloides NP11]KAJ8291878.1 Hexose transporter 2 [Rhodotorula toruloides]CDR48392.1 RHTO0S17e02652g1_1 [Rhodotorula toruloides]
MVGYAGGNVVAAGLPQTSFRHNIRSFVFALAVAFGTFQYNLDTTIVNGFQAMQGFLRVFGVPGKGGKYVIETTFQQLITSLLQVGLIVASLLIGPFSRYFGRRAGFFVASVIGCVALLIQTFVTSKGPVYVARLLLGVSNGALVNLVVLWISETAPGHLRGSYVSSFQIFQGLGGITGAGISKAFAKNLSKHSYQLQLVVLFAVPVWFLLYSVIYMPESPRWLATHDRHDEALKSLRKIRGSNFSEAELQAELDIIVEAIRVEREVQAGATFLDIFRGTDLRRTLLACGAATLHAASGINFLVGYGTVFFQIAAPGSDAFRNTIILQVCGFIGALSAPVLARYFGRKTILIAGFSLMCMCFTIVGATNEGKLIHSPKDAPAGAALVAFVCLYQFAYNMSCGPLAWAVGAEIPSQRLRSLTFGFAMGVGFVFAWLTTFTTPKYLTELGVRVAWIWMPSCFITLLWLIFFLPETEGRSLEDLDIMFANRVPALKFKHYVIDHTIAVGGESEKDADSEKVKGTESRDEVAMV